MQWFSVEMSAVAANMTAIVCSVDACPRPLLPLALEDCYFAPSANGIPLDSAEYADGETPLASLQTTNL